MPLMPRWQLFTLSHYAPGTTCRDLMGSLVVSGKVTKGSYCAFRPENHGRALPAVAPAA